MQQQFGSDTEAFYCDFSQRGDLIICELKSELASLAFSLQGAHVLSWQPSAEEDVIWLSKDAQFSQGKSIRGGIPLCWPWFGTHETKPEYPAHGFARTVDWSLLGVKVTDAQIIKVHFQLDTRTLSPEIQNLWPNATVVDYYLEVGAEFKAKLVTTNVGNQSITIGQALHSYFAVGDVRDVVVKGLEGCDYLDKPKQFLRCNQLGNIHFSGEVDRVYIDTTAKLAIVDTHRTLHIAKQGSQTTIVWNPGEKVANTMGDLGENGHLKMLCVESANAANDTVTLAIGESTELSVTYQIMS